MEEASCFLSPVASAWANPKRLRQEDLKQLQNVDYHIDMNMLFAKLRFSFLWLEVLKEYFITREWPPKFWGLSKFSPICRGYFLPQLRKQGE